MIHSIIILYDFYRIIFNAFWLARIFGPRKVKLIPTFSQRNISLFKIHYVCFNLSLPA